MAAKVQSVLAQFVAGRFQLRLTQLALAVEGIGGGPSHQNRSCDLKPSA
ncbi:hypothetical protein P9272_33140 [Mesorhizobium sp. WSM4976]|nr:hypothetical protein [Mesorhizobium sp. WSM4976]MDG4898380.1 hypothetical protein [Mesorhizobium sp. WSM4976]